MVEDIEELGPELQRCVFPDSPHPRGFDGRSVKVELARPKKNADTGVAEAGSVADDRDRAERSGIDIARPVADPSQPAFSNPRMSLKG